MSVSYSCQLVAGVSVPKSALQRTSRGRGCGHAETKGAFCSECGKPMWVEEEGELALLFQSRDIETFKPNTESEDFEICDDTMPVIIGLRVSTGRNGLVEPIDMVDAKKRVLSAIEHVGIDTFGDFGLHLVCRVSY